jgi:prepilin-type N-terminal cleavage/methylation domain-containing protein
MFNNVGILQCAFMYRYFNCSVRATNKKVFIMGVYLVNKNRNSRGFSVIELLIALAVMSILAGYAVMTLSSKEMYNADDQAMVVLDVLKEARQRAITQREVMRVEINKDLSRIRLINENSGSTANDDVEIRNIQFSPLKQVIFDRAPNNIAAGPTEAAPVPTIVFKASVHPSSMPDNVATLRFQPNGTVLDAGSSATGLNASVSGATLYFWTPLKASNGSATNNGEVIRAITVMGNSGNTRYLMCPVSGTSCPTWK